MSVITEETLTGWIASHAVCMVYFKTQNCGVCEVMLPKVKDLASGFYIPFLSIDLTENLHLASSQMVLNVPVTKVFVHNREVWKEGAYQDLLKLKKFIHQTLESESTHG